MRKINTNDLVEETWSSPKGKFVGAGKEISEALGRKPQSTDLNERHPFDVEILRIPPGKIPYPYHSHSAQWEFYHLISAGASLGIRMGRLPSKPAMGLSSGRENLTNSLMTVRRDLILYVVADNPIGESTSYPDSKKWGRALTRTTTHPFRTAGRLRW